MAYIPPHRRRSNTGGPSPSLPPPSLQPRHSRTNKNRRYPIGSEIVYGPGSISRWFFAGDPVLHSLRLEPFPCESFQRKYGEKPYVLAGDPGGAEVEETVPWASIAERVVPDLIASARIARGALGGETEECSIKVVIRVGKILFRGDPSISVDCMIKAATTEADPRKLDKSFNTNVSSSYVDDIRSLVIPQIGFDFCTEKEFYHVKVYDKEQPDSIIKCKCIVVNDGELEIQKIELNPVRRLVFDISCVYKDLDMRLMLLTKRIMKVLNDENDGLNKLVKSAIIDPNEKGGLRWPIRKHFVDESERFSIIGVWHTKYNTFRGQGMTLKVRHAIRFDCKSSAEEVSDEVSLKLARLSKQLMDGDVESSYLQEMVDESVKLIWLNFLRCKGT